ncbi:MAG: single-stranded-DNA-specific exonuclease RecJ [Ruminococcaceae bacterium]|nr:single-stranded-DNA-specific exonuclease RecJ [Oscillospiraceae bacterium]
MQSKKWIMREKNYSADKALELARELGLPPLVVSILLSRGVRDVKKFVNTDISNLYDPFLMKDVSGAADRIIDAIKNKEKITVYGDYDVDGITSTVVLVRFLKSHGADVGYYIPDRLEEGYGINRDAIDSISESGTRLLITVDCGITAVAEIEYAKQKGMSVIVTDHHECKEVIPEADYVINPKQHDCKYPFKKLAGVGVVFKLIQAITIKLRFHMQEMIDEYIDLVAIGTVADVMPLEDENRIIVKNGLEHILYTSNYGIKALIKTAEIKTDNISTSTIGFGIAPRINAAGRMGTPDCAASLLLACDEIEAGKYAQVLEEENRKRQSLENDIFCQAVEIIDFCHEMKDDYVLVLDHDKWHHGIVGIVASKISEKYNKPCILISTDDEENAKGSGRSIKGFNLFEALCECSQHLTKFGGHELAAGLSTKKSRIEIFRKAINKYAKSILKPDDFIPVITIDAHLPIEYLNINTVEKFALLQPYGMGNPSPVFCTEGLCVASCRVLSDGKHLRLTLTKNNMYVDAVGFGMGEIASNIKPSDKVDVVYNLDVNTYRGEKHTQLHLRDIRLSKGN